MEKFWNDEGLPFLVVQLPGFDNWMGVQNIKYHVIREKQNQVADTVSNVWLCSIFDAGEACDVHPKNKRVVGERLALLARGHVYEEKILCDAPVAKDISVRLAQLWITFDNVGVELAIRGEELEALEIRKEGKSLSFSARTQGNALILSLAEETVGRLSVEFAQGKWYLVNLYNRTGIPAIPFAFDILQLGFKDTDVFHSEFWDSGKSYIHFYYGVSQALTIKFGTVTFVLIIMVTVSIKRVLQLFLRLN